MIGKRERKRTKHNYLNFFLNILGLNWNILPVYLVTSSTTPVHTGQRTNDTITKATNNLCSKEKENPIGSSCLESQLSINSRGRRYQFYVLSMTQMRNLAYIFF